MLAAFVLAWGASQARADEGMWLLNQPPREALKSRYGFDASDAWLEHLRKSSVRFETGGSGSIVSKDGLVMTNHHVGSDMLAKLSTKERDLLAKGFLARERGQELPCPDLELRVLWEIEDVTAKVRDGLEGLSALDANTQRRQRIATLEKESKDKSGLASEVVTLYHGARYHLYRSRAYTDVRLVFAPEGDIAFFGGDHDNFEFPRHNLDCCFFRIYENGKPLQAEHFLSWSEQGAKEGDLVLVCGNPGRTRRMFTTKHLAFLRDFELPARLQHLWRAESKLRAFRQKSAEHARVAAEIAHGVENGRKAYTGLLAGLLDPAVLERKAKDEAALRAEVERDPKSLEAWGSAWEEVEHATIAHSMIFAPRYVLTRATNEGLLGRALTVVRLIEELPKPSAERLPGFQDAELESTYLDVYSPEPVHEELEIARIEMALSEIAEQRGADEEFVQNLLGGKSPAAAARRAVLGTAMRTVEGRKKLVADGEKTRREPGDPLIALALVVDHELRSLDKAHETGVEAMERSAYAKIAAARFAKYGESLYPDATFTPRLAFGVVKGGPEPATPAFTTLGGAFALEERRRGQEDFVLPRSWTAARDKLDLTVPFNFACTADIIGGNSGSPVVDREGRVVGLIFDGNIQSLVGDVVYDEGTNRAVAVDARGMIECFAKIYDANELVRELTGK